MSDKRFLQKFLQHIKESSKCHLSSDEEWPTMFLTKKEIFHNNDLQIKPGAIIKEILAKAKNEPISTSSDAISELPSYFQFPKKKANAKYIGEFVDQLLQSRFSWDCCDHQIRHASQERHEVKDLINTKLMIRSLVDRKKWVNALDIWIIMVSRPITTCL